MNEEIETLVLQVQADTRAFQNDMAQLQRQTEGPLASGFERAGQTLERSLARAIRNGKFGFDDLKSVALSALSEIASAALQSGLNAIGLGQSGGGAGGGLSGIVTQLASLIGGSPGRATGGPVSPGQAYMVGERGPELFVPTSSGQIAPGSSGGQPVVQLNIRVSDNGQSSAPAQMERSARHIARSVRGVLSR